MNSHNEHNAQSTTAASPDVDVCAPGAVLVVVAPGAGVAAAAGEVGVAFGAATALGAAPATNLQHMSLASCQIGEVVIRQKQHVASAPKGGARKLEHHV